MKRPRFVLTWIVINTATFMALLLGAAISRAQTSPIERTFRESKSTVEKALQQLQLPLSGRVPTLEGFAQPGEHSLSRYQRGFYQCALQVSTTPAGGSVVRVSAKLTAWYADANASRSGYRLLKSNGRIEMDVLDQLSEGLLSVSVNAEKRPNTGQPSPAASAQTAKQIDIDAPPVSTPEPRSGTTAAFSPSLGQEFAASELNSRRSIDAKPTPKESDLRSEAASLEEVLKNQAHPRNLVAVKKSGTPVVASPSLSGKTLFLASAQDEFEMLDYSSDWVHVRISGLSRGWIWRTSLEMPEGIPDVPRPVATSAPTAAELFQVSREETAQFPGDWGPLRGKNVKIISVQNIRENEKGGGPSAKLEFAKSLFDKSYAGLAKSPDLAGVVLIFDSVDGGMIAATVPTIQRWKAGKLNDAAMWHQCYFDPPETFTISSAAGGR